MELLEKKKIDKKIEARLRRRKTGKREDGEWGRVRDYTGSGDVGQVAPSTDNNEMCEGESGRSRGLYENSSGRLDMSVR